MDIPLATSEAPLPWSVRSSPTDADLKDLVDHFNQPGFVLVNDNFEFPDLLGAAYEYLIKYFADSAGNHWRVL